MRQRRVRPAAQVVAASAVPSARGRRRVAPGAGGLAATAPRATPPPRAPVAPELPPASPVAERTLRQAAVPMAAMSAALAGAPVSALTPIRSDLAMAPLARPAPSRVMPRGFLRLQVAVARRPPGRTNAGAPAVAWPRGHPHTVRGWHCEPPAAPPRGAQAGAPGGGQQRPATGTAACDHAVPHGGALATLRPVASPSCGP